jgi:DNA-directed RNA polymerase specialized sigma24 family protein
MAETQEPVDSSSISPEQWEQVRVLLVFYFSHRCCREPEDLAQTVLQRVWEKLNKGLTLEGENGLVKYSYTVAGYVLQEARKARPTEELKDSFAAPMPNTRGLNTMEAGRLVREVLAQLPEGGGDLIWDAETMDHGEAAVKRNTSVKNYRVMTSRARKKLRKLLGLATD